MHDNRQASAIVIFFILLSNSTYTLLSIKKEKLNTHISNDILCHDLNNVLARYICHLMTLM